MGLFFAAFFTAFVALTHGIGPFEQWGITFWEVAAVYFIGGVVVGSIVALLHPLTGTLLGRMFVGFVAMIPCTFMLSSLLGPPPRLDWATVWNILGYSAVMGPLYGAATMARLTRQEKS
jgi:hypothetical protein